MLDIQNKQMEKDCTAPKTSSIGKENKEVKGQKAIKSK